MLFTESEHLIKFGIILEGPGDGADPVRARDQGSDLPLSSASCFSTISRRCSIVLAWLVLLKRGRHLLDGRHSARLVSSLEFYQIARSDEQDRIPQQSRKTNMVFPGTGSEFCMVSAKLKTPDRDRDAAEPQDSVESSRRIA